MPSQSTTFAYSLISTLSSAPHFLGTSPRQRVARAYPALKWSEERVRLRCGFAIVVKHFPVAEYFIVLIVG